MVVRIDSSVWHSTNPLVWAMELSDIYPALKMHSMSCVQTTANIVVRRYDVYVTLTLFTYVFTYLLDLLCCAFANNYHQIPKQIA